MTAVLIGLGHFSYCIVLTPACGFVGIEPFPNDASQLKSVQADEEYIPADDRHQGLSLIVEIGHQAARRDYRQQSQMQYVPHHV